MADEKRTVLTVDDAQRKLRDLEIRYGSGVQITIDKDFNIELYDAPDRAEETPEESLKRAERQRKAINDARAKQEVAPGVFTGPVQTLEVKDKPAQTLKERPREGR